MAAEGMDDASPEIQELARNLHNDPKLFFEFVRNKIEYVPYYGFMKGAKQTLLDRAGNDADQAALLAALLRAANYPVTYKNAFQRIPTTSATSSNTAASWFDVEDNAYAVENVLRYNGIPGSNTASWTIMNRTWIETTVSGQVYQLDAAFKPHRRKSPLNFASLMNYNRAGFLSAVGGQSTDAYVQNLNEINLAQKLVEFSTNLVESLRANYFNSSIEDVLGNSEIIEAVVTNLPTSLLFTLEGVASTWSTPPTNLTHSIRLQHGGIDKTYLMAEIAGKQLSVTYEPAGNENNVEGISGSAWPVTYVGMKATALLGSTVIGTISIHNTTGATIPVDNIVWVGEYTANIFLLDNCSPFTLQPYGNKSWNVSFVCCAVGTHQGSYRLTSGSSYVDIPLQGLGVDRTYTRTTTTTNFPLQYTLLELYTPTQREISGIIEFKNVGAYSLYITALEPIANWNDVSLDDWSGAGSWMPPGWVEQRTLSFYHYDYSAPKTVYSMLRIGYEYNSTTGSVYVPFRCHSFIPCARLRLETNLVAHESGVMTGAVGNMTINLGHPNAFGNQTVNYPLKRDSNYAIITDFGQSHKGYLLDERQRLLDDYRRAGYADDSREVLTETLNVMGQTWMRQTALADEVLNRISNVRQVYLHRLGVMAQEAGYYIDVKAQMTSIYSRNANYSQEDTRFKSGGLINSALEHGILEQMQGTNRPGASTVKLLQLANAANKKIFMATASSYAGSVRPYLSNYSTSELDEFQGRVNQGQMLILPEDAQITLAEWRGKGYVQYGPTGEGYIEMGMIIGGNYYGGYAGYQGNVNTPVAVQSYQPAKLQPSYIPQQLVKDPVDIASGNFAYDRTDLVVGSGVPPLGMTLKRVYNSGQHSLRSSLGYGWNHNLNIKAQVRSEGSAGLGLRTPVDAAAMIAAEVVIDDLIANENTPKSWATAALAAKWAIDRLNDNAVSIQAGDRNTEFIRLPDGSYSPPPDSTEELTKPSGTFILKERFGEVLEFGANNRISTWKDADSNSMSFAYNAQTNIQTATDAFGRALTLNYTGNDLVSVSDGTGRSVSYGIVNGDLTSFTDPEGKVWQQTYNSKHQLVSAKDPLNQTTVSNIYSAVSGKVLAQRNGAGNLWNMYVVPQYRGVEEDPFTNRTVYLFDNMSRQVAVIDALGNKRSTTYDGQGHVLTQRDAKGNLTRREYDRRHNLTNLVDALGHSTAFAYDSQDRPVKVRDPLGHETQTEYDSEHHPVRMIDALNNETTWTYYPNGLLQTRTAPRGIVTSYSYENSYGNPATITRTDGGAVSNVWNARGDLIQSSDALGHMTTYTWDARRLPTSERDAMGSAVSNIYNAAGLLVTNKDRRGFATTTTWTPTYKPLTVRYPDGGIASNVYDAADRLVKMRDARGFWTSNRYDAAGRLAAVVNALGSVVSNSYDQNGNVTVFRDAKGFVTSNQYDALNRMVSVRDPLGHVSSNQYDELGRLTASVDPQGKRTQYEYDALSRKTAVIRPNGAIDRFAYDEAGNQVAYQNPEGARIAFGFDRMNRMTSETNAIGQTQYTQYDVTGNMTLRTDAQGRQTRYEYDLLNRLTNTVYPNGSTASFAYLTDGKLNAARSALSTNIFTYDSMGRMTQTLFYALSGASTVSYSYDLAGNRTALSYPGNKTAAFAFDPLGQATNVKAVSLGITNAAYAFDQAGNLTGIGLSGNVNGSFTPDALSRVTAYSYTEAASNFVQRTITRNASGIKIEENIGVGYHPLPPATRQTHEHNAADELMHISRLDAETWTNAVLSYDPNGNMTQALHSVNGQIARSVYRWDFENHLLYASSGASTVSFSYDALGNLVGLEKNGTNTFFVRDYADPLKRPLMQVNSDGNPLKYFVWSNGRLLAQVETNGAVRYAHFDELGNLLALTDSGGNVTDQFYYEAYGQLRARTGSTEIPFSWLGAYGVMCAGEDLYLTLHRAYHAGLQRFVQADPLGLEGGLNLYAYGAGNPMAFIDPLGLDYRYIYMGPHRVVEIQTQPNGISRRYDWTSNTEETSLAELAIPVAFGNTVPGQWRQVVEAPGIHGRWSPTTGEEDQALVNRFDSLVREGVGQRGYNLYSGNSFQMPARMVDDVLSQARQSPDKPCK